MIEDLDGIFESSALTTLPNNLFGFSVNDKTNATHTALITMRGMFANCTELTGHVSKNFFRLAPNLLQIGATVGGAGPGGMQLPGIFANTKISSCDSATLQNLSKLERCDLMFFNGSTSGSNSTFAPIIPLPDYFEGFTEDDNTSDISTVVPLNLFKGCTNLKVATMMFAGR
jgi:hypothetical protein